MNSYKFSIIFCLLMLSTLSFSACDDNNIIDNIDGDIDGDSDNESWDGICTNERDGWEKCDNNRIQWCHVLEGMDPHFHEGSNCEALGLTCVEHAHEHDGHTDYEAFCVDESMTCEEGEFTCVDNTARNCIDGVMALEPCGTMLCHEETDEAVCEQEGDAECGGHGHMESDECHCDENYEVDPDDSTNCVATLSFPEIACQTFTDYKDDIPEDHQLEATDTTPGPHAHLDEVMQVQLLAANSSNYVHFPVLETGEYVLFLDTEGVAVNFYDKAGVEVPFTNPGPNGFCSDSLVDHFHISATYTGEGSDPVPTIMEFQVEADTEVRFLIMFHEEDEHDHE